MMNSLFRKFLLALAASTILALLLTTVVSRAMLHRGFEQFLERQEERQLQLLVPELAGLYSRSGSWAELQNHPRRWMSVLKQTRPEGVRPPDEAPPEFRREPPPPPFEPSEVKRKPGEQGSPRGHFPGERPEARWHLWRRLFLLDDERKWVAGAQSEAASGQTDLLAVEVRGKVVGWVGFLPVEGELAPEVSGFLEHQNRSLFAALLLALLPALILAFVLARNLSRPVERLRDTVEQLSRGHFAVRASVAGTDEIGELGRHINQLAESLEKNETARRRWTADAAHELRTPLAVLQGELEAVKDGVRPYSPALVDSLQEEVSHLTRLVDDLQTLALADAGALKIVAQSFDMARLVRQVLETFTDRISRAGLTLESRLPGELWLTADAQRIKQLLHNLLENSCRYSHPGGQIRVVLETADDRLVLTIDDSPPGLSAAQRTRLFERFYRTDPSRDRTGGGSGLGLAICRNLVEAHGGDIRVGESELGGIAIRVSLPNVA